MVESAGVGVTPDPSHWKTGVPVTPLGRMTEQVRVTVSPAMMEGEEEVREIVAGSVGEISSLHSLFISCMQSQYTYGDIWSSSHITG